MSEQPSVLRAVLTALAGYAAMELYLALRPPDLTERLSAWMNTRHGRFETFYAEWRRDREHERDTRPPVGD